METTVQTGRSEAPPDVPADVLRYLEALRAEQAKFLGAVSSARAMLGTGTGQLGQLSAVHGRLTRQFFDAQRSLLQRRAEIDAEVARIAAETEDHASVVLASAVAHAVVGQFEPPQPADLRIAADEQVPVSSVARAEQTSRQAIAALGLLAARSAADAEALERVINDAFAPAEPDLARMEREMQTVLDAWWTAEVNEGTALIEDARARAAMRLHLAHLEACEIAGAVAPAATHQHHEPVSLLPSTVVQTLEGAGQSSLDDVFAALQRSLTPAPRNQPDRIVVSGNPAPAAGAEPATAGHVTPVDQFQHFWHHELAPTEQRTLSPSSVLRRIVVPMFAVTSGLALALAWIG